MSANTVSVIVAVKIKILLSQEQYSQFVQSVRLTTLLVKAIRSAGNEMLEDSQKAHPSSALTEGTVGVCFKHHLLWRVEVSSTSGLCKRSLLGVWRWCVRDHACKSMF